ncbi:MAG: trypsin-like peptidase domain-containing protein [Oscillospiraceae bacterium]|nr:trypsin-like peptidase domain-containing protein [Oscillospiraceae bacterium]
MNKNDWYNTESWYAPFQQEPAQGTAAAPIKEKKKGWKPWHVLAIVALVALLIVASSLIFGGSGKGNVPEDAQDWENEQLPDDWKDFFENFYTGVETDIAQIDIPRSELFPDFELTLREAEGEELDLQQLYERCADSIVAISGYREGRAGYYWGTGVIISADGLVLTNTHVIDDCDSATVTLYDDSEYEAKLVGADSINDIALLKIEATGLPAATFGDSSSLMVGDRVAAIGNPLGQTFRGTLTDGIISAIERGIGYNGHSMTLLQTNTALNEGNSGGALFNMYGQVIGITNMKMRSSYSSIEGIGFAIPSATVRSVVNSIVRYGEMRGRPAIGITVGAIPQNAASHYDLPEGVYVSDVSKGSDAEAKGVQVGDIILEVNHIPVKTTAEINDLKNELQVGDTMTFTIWRDGETLEIEVELMDLIDIYGG